MFRSEISFGFRVYQDLRAGESQGRDELGESFAIGCVGKWQGGWTGNSCTEQGEEGGESQMELEKAAIE